MITVKNISTDNQAWAVTAPTHLSTLAIALGLWPTSTTLRVELVQTRSCPKATTTGKKETVLVPLLKKGLQYKFNPCQVPVSIHRWVLMLPQEPSTQGRLANNQKTTWTGPGFIHPSAHGTTDTLLICKTSIYWERARTWQTVLNFHLGSAIKIPF